MRALAWRLGLRVAFCGVGALVTLFFPVRRGLVLEVFLLVVGGLVLETLVRTTALAQPVGASAFEAALRRRRRAPARPQALEQLEDQVALAAVSAIDLHTRLLPTVRALASELLLSRRAIDLAADPEAARAALGEEAWAFLRPDLGLPADRFGRGLSPARLRAVLDAVEGI